MVVVFVVVLVVFVVHVVCLQLLIAWCTHKSACCKPLPLYSRNAQRRSIDFRFLWQNALNNVSCSAARVHVNANTNAYVHVRIPMCICIRMVLVLVGMQHIVQLGKLVLTTIIIITCVTSSQWLRSRTRALHRVVVVVELLLLLMRIRNGRWCEGLRPLRWTGFSRASFSTRSVRAVSSPPICAFSTSTTRLLLSISFAEPLAVTCSWGCIHCSSFMAPPVCRSFK